MANIEVGQRNTPVWGLNLLRRDALVQLMNDLLLYEEQGIEEKLCSKIKRALAHLVNQTSAIPDDSRFRSNIWELFQKFETLYAAWNDVKGASADSQADRRQCLLHLRKARHKLAVAIRKNMHVLDNELDLQTIDAMYEGFRILVTDVPKALPQLALSIGRYTERREAGG